MLDDTRPDPGRHPFWDPTGWTPVFFGEGGEEQLIGHSQLQLPDNINCLSLSAPDPFDGKPVLRGRLIKFAHNDGDGLLWAWRLERLEDAFYIPKFKRLTTDSPSSVLH